MRCDEWQAYPLSAVTKLVIDYRGKTPKKLGGDWCESGYPALSAKNIKTGTLVQEESIRFVDESLYKRWMKDEIERGDILITSEAPFGQVYHWDSDEKIVLSQRLFGIRLTEEVHPRFGYYYMTTDQFQSELANRATGTTVTGLRQPELLKCLIRYPSLPEQRAIAATLSCLDDKIELNNRMNKNLEEMAQALFKSWFVDFDPVKAKMEGREPAGMDAETAALFPEEFEDSELGPIPKGWRVSLLEDLIELFDSKRVPLSSRQRTSMAKIYPYYGAASLMDYVDDYIFDGTYVLLGEDGTVVDDKGFPVLQYVWGKFWVNNHAHVLQGRAGFNVDSLYMLLRHTHVAPIITGAVQAKISQARLKSIKTNISSPGLLKVYNGLVAGLFAKKREVLDENTRLTVLRDTLLPKLMSGEIRVPEAEGILEEVL